MVARQEYYPTGFIFWPYVTGHVYTILNSTMYYDYLNVNFDQLSLNCIYSFPIFHQVEFTYNFFHTTYGFEKYFILTPMKFTKSLIQFSGVAHTDFQLIGLIPKSYSGFNSMSFMHSVGLASPGL